MARRTTNQSAVRVQFVRPVREIDEDFEREGFMFLALELEEIPPAEKRRTRKASTARKRPSEHKKALT